MREFKLLSPLAPSECAAKLQAAIGRVGFSWWEGSESVCGTVNPERISLRRRIAGRNGAFCLVNGNLIPINGGTLLKCEVGIPRVAFGGMCLFAGVFALVGFIITVLGFSNWLDGGKNPTILMPLAFLIVGCAIVPLSCLQAKADEKMLFEFLCETINAYELKTKINLD